MSDKQKLINVLKIIIILAMSMIIGPAILFFIHLFDLNKKAEKTIFILIAVFWLAALSANIAYNSLGSEHFMSGKEQILEKDPDILTVDELYKQYDENPVALKYKYDIKEIIVTGTIKDIALTSDYTYIIKIKGNDNKYLDCKFDYNYASESDDKDANKAIEDVIKLKPGDNIKVKGTIYISDEINFNECEIVTEINNKAGNKT